MKNKIYIILFILCFSSIKATSQFINFYKPAPYQIEEAPLWAKKMYEENVNVNEVDKLYAEYYKEHVFEKNYHTQYYIRWRRFIADYINEDGLIILPTVEQFNEKNQEIKNKFYSLAGSRSSANWESIGPYQVYTNDEGLSNDQTNVYSIDQSLSNPDILFCGTEPGEIYKSINGGASWECISYPYYFAGVEAIEIDPVNPDIVYAANGWNIYKTTDGGVTWNSVLSVTSLWPHEILVNPSNTNIILAACDAGLYRSEDGGSSWTVLYAHRSWDVKLKADNDNIVYLLKDNPSDKRAEFYISDDMGATFTLKDNGWYNSSDADRYDGGARLAVTPADPNRIYAYLIGDSKASDYGYIGIYRSDDGGENWYLPNGPVGSPYSTTHQNLAIGWVGWNYHQGFYNCALMAKNDDADKILIGGLNLWKSDDGGYTFVPLGGYISSTLNMHPDMQDFRATETGYWITCDGGVNFSSDFFMSENERKSAGIHGAEYWGFGQGWNEDITVGGLYHNGNIAQYENYGEGNYLQLGGAEPASGYVNPGNNRKIYTSDLGSAIIPTTIGSEPIIYGGVGLFPNESYWSAYSSEMEFYPANYNIVFLGNENKLWKSTDGSTSFNVVHTFGTDAEAAIGYFEIARSNYNEMYVAQRPASGSVGKLWKTSDGGETFSELIIPSASGYKDRILLALNPENENDIYLAYPGASDGSKTFHSTDGGITWNNITSSILNGEEIRSIVYIGGTDGGVYACTNYAVYYRNNTTEWFAYYDGLPFFANTDIAKPFYRDRKLRLATYGKGIWQSDFYENPLHPIAQPMVDKFNTFCSADTFYFEDYSILMHEGASWNWSFVGGTPSSSTLRNPKVTFDEIGEHEATLTVTDINGNTDSKSVVVNLNAIDQTEIAETFEEIFPPEYWTTSGLNAGTGIWNKTSDAGGYAESTSSALANNFWYDLQGAYGDLRAFINLSDVSSPELFYDVAYVQYDNFYSDTLVILLSTDCGETVTEIFRAGGDDLATAPDYTADVFHPEATDWRTDSLDLSIAAGEENVQIIFRNIGRWGQALYIDNVNVKGIYASVENAANETNVNIYPNPVAAGNAITIAGNVQEEFTVELFDTNGKMISKEKIKTNTSLLLDKKTFAPGIYHYRLKGENYMRMGKLVIM